MQSTLNLLAFFVLFLFILYLYAREDHILIRKAISLDSVFDLVFVCSLVALLCARVGFVVINFKLVYLNPLVFLVFPYYPGLNTSAGLLGGALYLLSSTRRHKLPTGRLFDLIALAFLCSLSLLYLLEILTGLIKKHPSIMELITGLIFFAAFILLHIINRKSKWADGVVAAIVVSLFSLTSIAINTIQFHNNVTLLLKENIFNSLLFLGLIVSAVKKFIIKEKDPIV